MHRDRMEVHIAGHPAHCKGDRLPRCGRRSSPTFVCPRLCTDKDVVGGISLVIRIGIALVFFEIGQAIAIQISSGIVNQWIQSVVDLKSIRHVVGIGIRLVGICSVIEFLTICEVITIRVFRRIVHIMFLLPRVRNIIAVAVDTN